MKKYDVLSETLKLGLAVSVIAVALPDLSWAATTNTVGDILTSTTDSQVKPAATLLAALCYVGGAISLVSGALSLRKHADNPASEPMGKGLTRLLVGAGIMGLPYLAGVMQDTLFATGETQADYSGFSAFSPSGAATP